MEKEVKVNCYDFYGKFVETLNIKRFNYPRFTEKGLSTDRKIFKSTQSDLEKVEEELKFLHDLFSDNDEVTLYIEEKEDYYKVLAVGKLEK